MKKGIRSKLFLLLKVCIFNILAAVSVQAWAEYYLVYSSPEFSESCVNCQSTPHRHKYYGHKKTHKRYSHRHYGPRTGLFVTYAVPPCGCIPTWPLYSCQCCPQTNRVRTEYGDYVVFSSRPVDRRHGIYPEPESSYNPDMSTGDDGRADLEINQ